MDFDKREQQLDQRVLDLFHLFQKKETCLMCKIVKQFEKKLGGKETEKMFLTDFKHREHNHRICFLDTYIFLKIGDGLRGFDSKKMKDMAVEQYEQVLSFVRAKQKNPF